MVFPQNPYPIVGIFSLVGVPTQGITITGTNITSGGSEQVVTDTDGSFLIDPANMGGYNDGDVIRIQAQSSSVNVTIDLINNPEGLVQDMNIPTNAEITNLCWGAGLTPPCSIPFQEQAVHAGTALKINTDIQNTGPNGLIRAVFFANGIQISDQNTTLNGGLWSPNKLYPMPNKNVNLLVNAYSWDGSGWTLTDAKTATIYPLLEFNVTIYTHVYAPQGG